MLIVPQIRHTKRTRLKFFADLVVLVDEHSLHTASDNTTFTDVVCFFRCNKAVGNDGSLFAFFRRCVPFTVPLAFFHQHFGDILVSGGRTVACVKEVVRYDAVDGDALVAQCVDCGSSQNVAVCAGDLSVDRRCFYVILSCDQYGRIIFERCGDRQRLFVGGFCDNRNYVAFDFCESLVAYAEHYVATVGRYRVDDNRVVLFESGLFGLACLYGQSGKHNRCFHLERDHLLNVRQTVDRYDQIEVEILRCFCVNT